MSQVSRWWTLNQNHWSTVVKIATQHGGMSWVHFGGTSNTNVIAPHTAGEFVSKNDCVFVALESTPFTVTPLVPGRIYKADLNVRAKSCSAILLGFTDASGGNGDAVGVKLAGTLGGFTGLTPGDFLVPSSITPGQLMVLDPSQTSCIPVARAISSTEILILRQSPKLRGWGYVVGGYTTVGANSITTIQRLSFATSMWNISPNVLIVNNYQLGGYSSGTKAYRVNGNSQTSESIMAGTESVVQGSNPHALGIGPGAFASGESGYHSPGGAADGSKVAKHAFSTGTFSALASARNRNTGGVGGTNSCVKGYFAGGDGLYNNIDGLTFSTEIVAAVTTLSAARTYANGAPSATNAYFMGGQEAAYVNTIDMLTFSTETRSDAGDLTLARAGLGVFSSPVAAYAAAGGITNSQSSVVDALFFSTGTVTNMGRIPTAVTQSAGIAL